MVAKRVGRAAVAVLVGVASVAGLSSLARAEDCSNGSFQSTFALVQKTIFDNRGCNDGG